MQIPDRPPSRDHIKPRSKGYSLDGNRALVCQRCNHDKGSRTLGQWLTRLSRTGDARADHVAAFIERLLGI
jgi:5-methylcytosine-specific restriction endonuclease McrA